MMGADEAGPPPRQGAPTAIYPIILNHGGRLQTPGRLPAEFQHRRNRGVNARQRAMAERTNTFPADRLMQFRMGIHMGDDGRRGRGRRRRQHRRPSRPVTGPGGIAVSGKACQEAGKHPSVALPMPVAPVQEHRRADPCLDSQPAG
jgi:adenylate cyclase